MCVIVVVVFVVVVVLPGSTHFLFRRRGEGHFHMEFFKIIYKSITGQIQKLAVGHHCVYN